jgi:hypothetical protein
VRAEDGVAATSFPLLSLFEYGTDGAYILTG